MAGRALWKGIVTFGPVTVPVKLYTAVRADRVDFHLLHDADRVRLEQRMICPLDGEAVGREHTVKGVPVEADRYVVVDPSELEALEPESARTIEVLRFVKAAAIDPRYYDRPYFLGPDGDEAAAKYAALSESLSATGTVGVCRWVMRKRSFLGGLKCCAGALCLITMRWAGEVVAADTLPVPEAEVSDREMQTARYLMDTLAADFKPEDYKNTFADEVRELVARKARGEAVPARKARAPRATGDDTLLRTLEASLKQARGRKEAHAGA